MPLVEWDESKFTFIAQNPEKLLGAYISKLFPNKEILIDYSVDFKDKKLRFSFFLPNEFKILLFIQAPCRGWGCPCTVPPDPDL